MDDHLLRRQNWETLIWLVMEPKVERSLRDDALAELQRRLGTEALAWEAVRERMRLRVPFGLTPEWSPTVARDTEGGKTREEHPWIHENCRRDR